MSLSSTNPSSDNNHQPKTDNNIRLLVLDIDGTIAGHSNNINQSVKDAIAAVQAKGIQVAIATGRMYRSALRFHQEIGSTLPLMAYQGAWIQDPNTGEVLRHWSVSREISHQLLDYFEQPEWRSLLSIHCYINDQLYVREISKATKFYAKRSNIKPIPVGDLRQVLEKETTKVLALCDDVQLVQRLLSDLRRQYTPAQLYLTTSVDTFLEATNPVANKGKAVAYLAETILGLQRDNVMTIGDNFNDIEMIQYAGLGVAMGNAPEPVQAIADWVAPSIDFDGVVTAIEKFLL
ncbi:cof-like hydrolase [Richelia sinica FACHB-800]|uniref:Cof-like hydrolase n=1 Tax=Richelia sinica FACHB-800 TaxID=1357546 RepID=A0A975TAR7_9NOST|nr:Cof-type HAD-IIB family hydrolase [Richelia sinica]MBD2666663.1 HAD family phosphatase [Richelia sinica FACHB-800]QXE25282.1 cof-like hydrolase [Richelia sinica FACHB-800]